MDAGKDDAGDGGPALPIAGFTTGQMMLDWPGKLTVTVFLGGCNMECPFCHSWPLIHPGKDFVRKSEEEVLALLQEHADFYDAVCLTGGEPTLHDLAPFIRRIRAAGKLVKLDTNGTRPEALARLIDGELIDYVAMDYKAPMGRMKEVCGGAFRPEDVAESKRMLIDGHLPYEFRTTLVPAIHTQADIAEMGAELAGADKWFLQQFRGKDAGGEALVRPGVEWILEPARFGAETIEAMLAEARRHVKDVRLRGF